MYFIYLDTSRVFCYVWNMSCEHVEVDAMYLSRGANIYMMLMNSTHIINERKKSKMSANSLCSIHIPYIFHLNFVFENLFIKSFFQVDSKNNVYLNIITLFHYQIIHLTQHILPYLFIWPSWAFWADIQLCPWCDKRSNLHVTIYVNMVKWAMLRVWFNRKRLSECSNKHNFWNLREKTILETDFEKRNSCGTCMEREWNMMNLLTLWIFSFH